MSPSHTLLGCRRVASGLYVLYSQTIVKFGIMTLALVSVLKHMSGNLGWSKVFLSRQYYVEQFCVERPHTLFGWAVIIVCSWTSRKWSHISAKSSHSSSQVPPSLDRKKTTAFTSISEQQCCSTRQIRLAEFYLDPSFFTEPPTQQICTAIHHNAKHAWPFGSKV